jgi:transposase
MFDDGSNLGRFSIVCPCGCGDMIRIGEDRTERLKIIPAQPKVIVTVRPKYACPNKQGGIVQAAAPVHLIVSGVRPACQSSTA